MQDGREACAKTGGGQVGTSPGDLHNRRGEYAKSPDSRGSEGDIMQEKTLLYASGTHIHREDLQLLNGGLQKDNPEIFVQSAKIERKKFEEIT